MIPAYIFFAIAGIFLTAILVLLGDAALRKFDAWREQVAMRIRDDKMRRWGLVPFEDSTKEKQL